MHLIDSHTHLYGKTFDNDRAEMIERARQKGVQKFYLPGIDSESIDRILATEAEYPGVCVAMMGLHPCSVNDNWKAETALVQHWLEKRPFAAVGEIGLDFYWDKTFAAQQYEAFHFQNELALKHDLPIVIHTRNAMTETIEVVEGYKNRGLRGIFHCFGGSYEEAKQIVDLGFLLGIGGVVTYKNSGLGPVLEKIGLEHLVLETDSPYLTPAPHRGKRNESAYLAFVVARLAEIYKIDAGQIAAVTSANVERVFGP